MDEGSPEGTKDGLLDGTIHISSVGTKDGDKDGIRVGLILIDGAWDGLADGYGLSVVVLGPAEGCPVSVGEFDGTKDKLGRSDGESETLGAELGTPSMILLLTLSPLPIASFVEAVVPVSEEGSSTSKQKDPTFSTKRHS